MSMLLYFIVVNINFLWPFCFWSVAVNNVYKPENKPEMEPVVFFIYICDFIASFK